MVNPFEKIADIHNQGLDFIAKRFTKDIPTDEEIVGYIDEFFQETNGWTTSIEKAIMSSVVTNILNHKSDTKVNEKLDKLDLVHIDREQIIKILELQKSLTAEELLNEIAKAEQVVLATSYGRSKNIALLLISVAKKSIEYWNKEKNKPDSSWRKIKGALNKLPWKEDLEGAIDGAIVESIMDGIIVASHPIVAGVFIVKTIGHGIYASVKGCIKDAVIYEAGAVFQNGTDREIDLPERIKPRAKKND